MHLLQKHNYPGLLIVFEGIDGSGKGTQVDLLVNSISREGWGDKVILSKTPGGTKFGDFTRDVLFKSITTHELEPETASLMYFASHLETWAKIVEPALKDGKIVISDRWDAYSGYVYGVHGGVRSIHRRILDLRENSGPLPDLTVLLTGSPETFLARAQARRAEDHQEGKVWNNLAKQRVMQTVYMSHLPNAFIVPADRRVPEDIHVDIWREVYPLVRHHYALA